MGGLSNSAASARHTRATIWMILPLYIFTLIFVACPYICDKAQNIIIRVIKILTDIIISIFSSRFQYNRK